MLVFYIICYGLSAIGLFVSYFKNKFGLLIMFLMLLIFFSCSMGIQVGRFQGEKNVLSGTPTYKMVINKHVDGGVETCDTTFVKK